MCRHCEHAITVIDGEYQDETWCVWIKDGGPTGKSRLASELGGCDGYADVEIAYCPMCGRELNGGER